MSWTTSLRGRAAHWAEVGHRRALCGVNCAWRETRAPGLPPPIDRCLTCERALQARRGASPPAVGARHAVPSPQTETGR